MPLVSKSLWLFVGAVLLAAVAPLSRAQSFAPDETMPPKTEPAPVPVDGATVGANPPSLVWKTDARAARYIVELARDPDFTTEVVRVAGIPYAFYNHARPLTAGTWYWRYFVVDAEGRQSAPSRVKRFVIDAGVSHLPLPIMTDVLAALPPHPRIFTTRATLAEFQARREGAGRMAWEQVRLRAEEVLKLEPVKPVLSPLPAKLPAHRRQVFWVENGVSYVPEKYALADLNRDAGRAGLLSLAYLISGDERFAVAARRWVLFVAQFRIDHHLKLLAERGQHDSVVYAYERGVKEVALTYDRLFNRLTPEERRQLLEHMEYHGEAAMHWIRNVIKIHQHFQDSHAQQCMHMTLTLALAIAGESTKAGEWLGYMVPQYANRIPWMSEDGGYFEGQAYAFKLSYILEALAALRSATGIDLFQKPEIRNAGNFWLYCQSMNYWWPHWGDTMGLWFPYGNLGDGYLSALLASATGNRPLQWWSNTVAADPAIPPLGYLAATGVKPRPPVDTAQARAFVPTGVVAAFDRHYDEQTTRLFFRSSPWGGESHAHADQNSFVLHSGGEIFAADTGYYTYYGDQNYNEVLTQTIAHNSLLVNGRGQLNDATGEGRITAYFHSPRYTFMAGDASKAYGDAMRSFRRDVLLVRPNLVIIADEVAAAQPATFTWLLNGFVPPRIDAARREFTVSSRDHELWGKHVFPEGLKYDTSNLKLTPRKTKLWTRYTEAFPEPWRLHAETEKSERADFLTVLTPYSKVDGRRVDVVNASRDEHGTALQVKTTSGVATLLFRRRIEEAGLLAGAGLQTDGRVAMVERGEAAQLVSWLAVNARELTWEGRRLLSASQPVSVAWALPSAARAQVSVNATGPTRVALALAERPQRLERAAAEAAERTTAVPIAWQDGVLTCDLPAGEHTLWIDVRVPFDRRPAVLTVRCEAADAAEDVAFETTQAENGDWVAFATLMPKATGRYLVRSADSGMEILVRDRWDPERSVRGRGEVRALVADATEIILRFAPSATFPQVTLKCEEPVPRSRINLLRNGDCEAGLPGYPPRGWSVQNGAASETYGEAGDQGWPGWSEEAAASGKASLKFTRPVNHTVDWRPPNVVLARNQMVALAPPVRLLEGGRHRLACQTRGSATTATIELETSAGIVHTLPCGPSTDWQLRAMEMDLPAGYTLVRVKFKEGGRDDQLLWADDFFLARVDRDAG